MNEALKEAKIGFEKNEIPVGCVIVKDNLIIGRGHNQKEEKNDATYHAEINAIRQASKHLENWWLENCDIYVTLEPCPMCAGALLNSRIRKLYVGAKDSRMGATGSALDLSKVQYFNHKFEVEFGILEDQCRNILSSFFKILRSKN